MAAADHRRNSAVSASPATRSALARRRISMRTDSNRFTAAARRPATAGCTRVAGWRRPPSRRPTRRSIPWYITTTRSARCLTTDKIVRDEQIRQSEPLLQVQQQVDDARLDRDVEGGHRFVEREDLRLQCQRAGDADALLLPAGELGGVSAGVLRGATRRCSAARRPVRRRRFLSKPLAVNGSASSVEDRQPGVQGRDGVLEDHLQIAAQARRDRRSRVATSWPSTSIEPLCGAVSSRTSCSVVDFPDPDSPTMPRVWPWRSAKLTPSTARTSPIWRRNTDALGQGEGLDEIATVSTTGASGSAALSIGAVDTP